MYQCFTLYIELKTSGHKVPNSISQYNIGSPNYETFHGVHHALGLIFSGIMVDSRKFKQLLLYILLFSDYSS